MISVDAQGDETGRYFYHFDGLGSVIALSNMNGQIVEAYSYDVFGTPTIYTVAGADGLWRTSDDTIASASAIGNPYLFTGRRYDDETGLYYYRARMYSPALGRFLQPDPIGYADSMNLYTYVGNNPTSWIDPWGLCESSEEYTTPSGEVILVPRRYTPVRTVVQMRWQNVIWWVNQVNHGGPRDPKRFGHKNMELTHREWEDVGNFDYGVSGSALGLPPWLLHWGARHAGGGTDQPRDTFMINEGIRWYEENKSVLTDEYLDNCELNDPWDVKNAL